MPFEPVTTDDGTAIKRDDSGWPIVRNTDGQEVAWDINRHHQSLHDANEQAKGYREALEGIAKVVGVEGPVDKAKTLEALSTRLATYGDESKELTSLRKMRDRGELDGDAESKIAAAREEAKASLEEEYAAKIQALEAKRSKAETESLRYRNELHGAMRRSGLEAFFDSCTTADAKSKLPHVEPQARTTFIDIASHPDSNGDYWKWNGKYDGAGTPQLIRVDASGENVRKGPDGIEPLTLSQWADTDLRRTHPLFFKRHSGSPDLDPSKPGGRSWVDLSNEDIASRVDRTYGAT